MKAIVVAATGGPEVLNYTNTERPTATAGKVVVDVAAAGLNYIDTYHRTGLYPMEMPFTPGLEGAGVVAEAGEGVSEVSVGDHVAWTKCIGSYAESVLADPIDLMPVPDGISLETAAAVPLQAMTAHYLVRDTYELAPGDRCLIHAGAGGVGLLAIQMAKIIGAEVFTTVSTEAKAALAAEAGADHVIRYDAFDFAEAITDIAGPRPLDVIYDGVGVQTFEPGLGLLRVRGMMALFGQSSGPVPPFDLGKLAANGSLFVTRPTLFSYISTREELMAKAEEIFGWIGSGALNIRIGQTWPLAEARAAHEALEGRATTGKTLLIP